MKAARILAVSVASLLATVSLVAQGRINFNNNSASRIYIGNPSNFTVLGTASTATFGIGPASVRISLYAGLTSSSLSPVLIGTAANQLYVTNTASAIASAQGTFNGGNVVPLPGFDGSTPAFLQVVFDSINGLYRGMSPILQVVPSLAPNPPTPVFGPLGNPNAWDSTDPWNGFSLSIGIGLPEPSALTLTGSSFTVMFFARRKMRGNWLKDLP